MPRSRRISPDNFVHHVINRGNKREVVFRDGADRDHFMNLLADVAEKVPMRILAACVMSNHFHLVLWPERGADLSEFMQQLMNDQIPRLQKRHGLAGLGHVYQGRFRNFLVQTDDHLYQVLRYVEANPLRACLVDRAEDYRWSTRSMLLTPDGREYVSVWPVARPANWSDYVNGGIPPEELSALRNATRRGCPYGDERWVEATVAEYGLEATVNKPGRRRSCDLQIASAYAVDIDALTAPI